MWVTMRFPGRFGIGSSAATVTVSRTGAPCVLPAVGAEVRSMPLIPECCARATCSAKPPPTISTANTMIRVVFIIDLLRLLCGNLVISVPVEVIRSALSTLLRLQIMNFRSKQYITKSNGFSLPLSRMLGHPHFGYCGSLETLSGQAADRVISPSNQKSECDSTSECDSASGSRRANRTVNALQVGRV